MNQFVQSVCGFTSLKGIALIAARVNEEGSVQVHETVLKTVPGVKA
jgi:hypothetical protein